MKLRALWRTGLPRLVLLTPGLVDGGSLSHRQRGHRTFARRPPGVRSVVHDVHVPDDERTATSPIGREGDSGIVNGPQRFRVSDSRIAKGDTLGFVKALSNKRSEKVREVMVDMQLLLREVWRFHSDDGREFVGSRQLAERTCCPSCRRMFWCSTAWYSMSCIKQTHLCICGLKQRNTQTKCTTTANVRERLAAARSGCSRPLSSCISSLVRGSLPLHRSRHVGDGERDSVLQSHLASPSHFRQTCGSLPQSLASCQRRRTKEHCVAGSYSRFREHFFNLSVISEGRDFDAVRHPLVLTNKNSLQAKGSTLLRRALRDDPIRLQTPDNPKMATNLGFLLATDHTRLVPK